MTIAGIYAYVDEALGGWEQRPLFKIHVSKLVPLRNCITAVDLKILRLLPKYFKSPSDDYALDPSYEPTAELHHPEHMEIFGHLQRLRAARLVMPVGEEHLYYTAMNSKSCRLTALGVHYWRLTNGEDLMMGVGITGHQRLDDPSAWSWGVRSKIASWTLCRPPVTAVSSLAIEADQLYRILSKADSVEILKTSGTDEEAYVAAGKRVVELSDMLIAMWNGHPAKGKGGTADIAAYASGKGVPIVHINPAERTITRRPGEVTHQRNGYPAENEAAY